MNELTRILLLTALLALAACNTVEGLGKDLGQAGNAVAGAAQKTKENLP